MENKTSGKRLGIIDIGIILILVFAIAGLAMRFYLVKNSPKDDTFYEIPKEKYLVSFIMRDKRFGYKNYLKKDEKFRFAATNKDFGVMADDVTLENAAKWYSYEGESYMVYNEGKNEHEQRFDITGSFIVEGKMNEDGFLVITNDDGSNTNVNVFSSLALRSDLIVFNVSVTGITPYSAAE